MILGESYERTIPEGANIEPPSGRIPSWGLSNLTVNKAEFGSLSNLQASFICPKVRFRLRKGGENYDFERQLQEIFARYTYEFPPVLFLSTVFLNYNDK